MDVVLASSPVDGDVGCWDLQTGAEQMRYRSCASAPHGLASVAGRFLASSQVGNSSSGSILYWSWHKPQVEIKSFPVEPIVSLVSDPDGSFLLGGGSSGNIYIWEIGSGKLLRKWQGHYLAVSCLLFLDNSLIASGSDDGCVRVWNLVSIFGERDNERMKDPFLFSFQEHALRITDIVSGFGSSNSILISSSEDRTCKVWSLSKGKQIRLITFPCIINAIALDPGEDVFYAGGRDGKIYLAALNATCPSNGKFDEYIITCLNEHSKAVTCLEITKDGLSLVSGSDDGTVRVWDIKSQRVIRVLKLRDGPVSNILLVQLPNSTSNLERVAKLPSLDKNLDPTGTLTAIRISPLNGPPDFGYCSSRLMLNAIKELKICLMDFSSVALLGQWRWSWTG
ncbi:transducin/WD40 repeat-like superfamily protein isoform X2 [Wolffia australiana]